MRQTTAGAAALLLASLMVLPATVQAGAMDGIADILIRKGVVTSDELKAQQKKRWLNVEGRIQSRYTWQEQSDPKDNISEFSVPRARFGAAGTAFPNVQVKFEVDFVPDTKQTETVSAEQDPDTGEIMITSSKGNIESSSRTGIRDVKMVFTHFDYANLTLGHFKVPFARQELTSSGNQQFVERSEVVRKEAQSRDVGLMIGEYNGTKLFEYAVGAFNGTKTSNRNDNDGFLLVGRVSVQPLGEFKYSESNLEGEWLRAALGASVQTNELTAAGSNAKLDFSGDSDDVETDTTKIGVDLGIKFLDNASLFAEYIQAKSDKEGSKETKAKGWYVQGGYFVLPPHLELAVRLEQYDPNDDVDDTSDITYTTLGLNYFFVKHDLKVQFNYVIRDEDDDPTSGKDKDDDLAMLQAQLKF